MDMPDADRFTTSITVDLDAIAHNVRALKKHVGVQVELIAVIKDDAYGHGAIPVGRVALESGATRLAVARVDEGIELRQAGIGAPVLLLCYAIPAEAEQIVRHDISATIATWEVAEALSGLAGGVGKTATVHIKVDTGMGRYGLLPHEIIAFMDGIKNLPHLQVEGIFTHFATADEADKSYALQQFQLFQEVVQAAADARYHFSVRHAANSAAILDLPATHLDAVRAGIAIYGLYPSDAVSRDVPLQPALALKSHVARVRTLPPGSAIGYGRTFITGRETPLALVPVGYGDGYRRTLSNCGVVLIRGRRAPIRGRVSMDQFVVDVSGIETVWQDDEVVLIGQQGSQRIAAEELAVLAGTINYEIVTGLSRRIPRLYLRGGQVVSISRMISDSSGVAASYDVFTPDDRSTATG